MQAMYTHKSTSSKLRGTGVRTETCRSARANDRSYSGHPLQTCRSSGACLAYAPPTSVTGNDPRVRSILLACRNGFTGAI